MKQWIVLAVIVLCFWGTFELSRDWLLHHADQPDQHVLKVLS